MRWMKLTVSLAIVAVAALLFVQRFDQRDVRRLQSRVNELERERAELLAYAERLTASRRVAQVDVVRQRIDSLGRTVSTLLWQEIRSDGLLAPPQAFEAVGSLVYFEALLINSITASSAPATASAEPAWPSFGVSSAMPSRRNPRRGWTR